MGLRTMWLSAVTGVIGAIIWRMLTTQIAGVDLRIVAVVLMLSGATGLGTSLVAYARSLRRRNQASFVLIPAVVPSHRGIWQPQATASSDLNLLEATAFAKGITARQEEIPG